MRVLIITVALAAISHAHLIPLAARQYNSDEWQEIKDQAREAAEELVNQLEEAKWDALDAVWDAADHFEQDGEQTIVEVPSEYTPGVISANPEVTHQVFHQVAPAKQTVVTQSLSQTHPGSLSHIVAPVFKIEQPAFEISQPALAISPSIKSTVVTQSLSQTQPAPYAGRIGASGFEITQPGMEIAQPSIEIAQPAIALSPTSKTTVVTQSLSQTHPPSISEGHAISQPAFEIANAAIEIAEPTVEIAQPAIALSPATKTVVTQSLSQTHPAPHTIGYIGATTFEIAQPAVEIASPAIKLAQPSLAFSPATKTSVVSQSLSQTHPASVSHVHAISQPALELTVPAVEYLHPQVKYAYPSVENAPTALFKPETKTVVTQSLDQTHPEVWPKAEIVW